MQFLECVLCIVLQYCFSYALIPLFSEYYNPPCVILITLTSDSLFHIQTVKSVISLHLRFLLLKSILPQDVHCCILIGINWKPPQTSKTIGMAKELTYNMTFSACQMRVIQTLYYAMLSCFSCVWPCATLWTVAHQASLSMAFSRQEYWSGFPCLSSGESSWPRDQSYVSYVSCIGRRVLCLGNPHKDFNDTRNNLV